MDTTDTRRRSARAEPRLTWHQRHNSSLTRGERAADRMRNTMGSWGFVAGFVVFMLVWAALNTGGIRWDPYPYILLNLFLSMLAGLQGAILLIAAKRQDGIAAALAQHDFDTNAAAKVMLAELQAILSRTVPEGAAVPSSDVVPLAAARRGGADN
jgi:uncharacterized membrane protein